MSLSRRLPAGGLALDVAGHPEFAGPEKTQTIEGVERTDWFTEDFTLAELRGLRTKERLPDIRPGGSALDGVDPIRRWTRC